MKSKSIFFIALLLLIITTLTAYGGSEIKIKDFSNLIIYVKNKEYDKKNVFLKDGELYGALDSLSKPLNFEYSWKSTESKLYINGNEYKGLYVLKGAKVYAALNPLCDFLGYYLGYNEKTNILDISGKPVYSQTNQGNNQTNTNVPNNSSSFSKGTIVPGKGIEGLVYLGVNINDVIATWGKAKAICSSRNGKEHIYNDIGLYVEQDNIIMIITVYSNNYKTSSGISTGSTLQQVESIYGKEYVEGDSAAFGGPKDVTMIFYKSGIIFFIDNKKRTVAAIAISPPK